MERIGTVIQRLNDSESAKTLSKPLLSEALQREEQRKVQLGQMMAQAQLFLPNQTLPPGTPDMYVKAWDEIAKEYGMSVFEGALWKVLRRATFFPLPVDIEDQCATMRETARDVMRKARQASEEAAWNEHLCLVAKERAEDALLPPRQPTALELKLQAILNAKDQEAERRIEARRAKEVIA